MLLGKSDAYAAVSGAGGGTPLSPTPASYQSAFATNAMGYPPLTFSACVVAQTHASSLA